MISNDIRDDLEMACAITTTWPPSPTKYIKGRLITKVILQFPIVIKVHQGSLMKLIRSSLVKLNVYIYFSPFPSNF